MSTTRSSSPQAPLTTDDLIGITLADLTDELLKDKSSFYVNVHTTQCSEGAIAGDLLKAA